MKTQNPKIRQADTQPSAAIDANMGTNMGAADTANTNANTAKAATGADRAALNETLARLTEQVQADGGCPPSLFMPLVQAVLAKMARPQWVSMDGLSIDKNGEAALVKPSEAPPLPYAWGGVAGASVLVHAAKALRHDAARRNIDPAEGVVALLDDAYTVLQANQATARGAAVADSRGCATSVIYAIASLAGQSLINGLADDFLEAMRHEGVDAAVAHDGEVQSEHHYRAMHVEGVQA